MRPFRLRVLSYNIHGRAHRFDRRYLERIARVIREAEPDVAGLQEVHRGGWIARYEDQAEQLAKLTGLTARFGPSFGEPGDEFGNAILTRGEIRGAEVVPLPAPGEPRTVLHARVAFPGEWEEELHVYATHLAAGFGPSRSARTLQASALLERLRLSNGPFVVVGDFNASPRAPELRTFLSADLFRLCGEGETACTHRILRQRIDWVLADPGWTTVASRVLQAGPSDHLPVLAELRRSE